MKTSRNSSHVLWRPSAFRTKISSIAALESDCSSVCFQGSSKSLCTEQQADTTGAPRPVVNSKGRRRRPGSKTLAQVLKCDDDLFVDFIAKCLVWDPERRLKPQAALRHPYIAAGKRTKVISPSPSAAKSLLNSSTSFSSNRSSKNLTETPKKSLISAPTPLTARSTRISSNAVPSTPSSSNNVHSTLGSSRTYRTAQSQSLSYHSNHSSRTMVRVPFLHVDPD